MSRIMEWCPDCGMPYGVASCDCDGTPDEMVNRKLQDELEEVKAERDTFKQQAEMYMKSYQEMADERDRLVIEMTAQSTEFAEAANEILRLKIELGEVADNRDATTGKDTVV